MCVCVFESYFTVTKDFGNGRRNLTSKPVNARISGPKKGLSWGRVKIGLNFVTKNFTTFFTARKEMCRLEHTLRASSAKELGVENVILASVTMISCLRILQVSHVGSLERPTRKPRHARVFSAHSDTQAVPAFHCIRIVTHSGTQAVPAFHCVRMFQGIFQHARF